MAGVGQQAAEGDFELGDEAVLVHDEELVFEAAGRGSLVDSPRNLGAQEPEPFPEPFSEPARGTESWHGVQARGESAYGAPHGEPAQRAMRTRIRSGAVLREREAREELLRADHDERSRQPAAPRAGATAGELFAGKYRIERVLGRNRMALNLQLRHRELGQRFLAVCVHDDVRSNVDTVGRFLRGARAAMQLQSAHAARTVDAGRLDSGAPYVITEYPAGSTLRSVLGITGVLSVPEAVDLVLQAAEAVVEAHARGIVHGRLCPSYLFYSRRPDGTPLIKVIGFGIAEGLCTGAFDTASIMDDATRAGQLGFPEIQVCVPPEYIRDWSDVDVRADVWGMGTVLHELLTGTPVYEAASAPALVAMIAADPPTPVRLLRPEIPQALEAIVLRCLAKDPTERFRSVAELCFALQPFGSPDAAVTVERILRTATRSHRPPPLHKGALVRTVQPEPAPPEQPARTPEKAPAPMRLGGIGATAAIAFGGFAALLLAAVIGASVAQRLTVPAPVNQSPAAPVILAPGPTAAPAAALAPVLPSAVTNRVVASAATGASTARPSDVAAPAVAAPQRAVRAAKRPEKPAPSETDAEKSTTKSPQPEPQLEAATASAKRDLFDDPE